MASFDGIPELEPDLQGAGLRIGVVMARFNVDIGEGLLSACVAELARCGVDPAQTLIATVPGALELPLALGAMARSGRFDALVALGAVIRGETYHFTVVSDLSAAGIAQVALDSGVPVANGVLTTEDEDQAVERMQVKGAETARVAVEMANLLRCFRG